MLKRHVFVLLVVILLFDIIGCSNEVELPEGVENEEFYKDMIKCLDLTKKTLETKNTKYVKEIEKLLNKYTYEDCFPDIFILDILGQDFGLSEKEDNILSAHIFLYFDLRSYLDKYFREDSYDTDVVIDTDTEQGKRLLKSIQETVGIMEIEYDLSFLD